MPPAVLCMFPCPHAPQQPFILSSQDCLPVPLTAGGAEPGLSGLPEAAGWLELSWDCSWVPGPDTGPQDLLLVPVLSSKIKDGLLKAHSLTQLYEFQWGCVFMCMTVAILPIFIIT